MNESKSRAVAATRVPLAVATSGAKPRSNAGDA
jgi:hypothetical protein